MKAGGKSVVTLAVALLVFPVVAMADNTNSSWTNSGATVSATDGLSTTLPLTSTITSAATASGSWSGSQPVGLTVLAFTTNGKFTDGSSSVPAISGGGLTDVAVPEPGTLGLVGIGLFGLAVILRRKLVRT